MTRDLEGRVALVTGGAAGIGAATAQALARDGADVVVLDRDLDGAARTCDSIVAAGGRARAVECDLGEQEQLDAVLDDVAGAGTPVTALCLNAGIGSLGTVETLVLAEWRHTLAVNLESNFHILRRLLAPMRAAGGGSIVAVSSLGAAHAGHPHSSPAYGVSKAALERLVLDVAERCAVDGIRANAVRPGPVATRFVAHRLPGPRNSEIAAPTGPSGDRADPADVAEIIAFLLSDRSRLMTGQTITADGGFSLPSADPTASHPSRGNRSR